MYGIFLRSTGVDFYLDVSCIRIEWRRWKSCHCLVWAGVAVFDNLFKLHEILAMFLTVALGAAVSMMFSKKPFSRGLALYSWICTIFLGLMLMIRIVIFVLDFLGFRY